MVVTESDEQLRARTIEKWIDIAERCRTLNNISSLTAILNGLLSQSVYRLAATWSHVTLNHRSILQQLQLVFSVSADPMEARKFLDKVKVDALEKTTSSVFVTHPRLSL